MWSLQHCVGNGTFLISLHFAKKDILALCEVYLNARFAFCFSYSKVYHVSRFIVKRVDLVCESISYYCSLHLLC